MTRPGSRPPSAASRDSTAATIAQRNFFSAQLLARSAQTRSPLEVACDGRQSALTGAVRAGILGAGGDFWEEMGATMLFTGSYRRALDDKQRLPLPKPLRDSLAPGARAVSDARTRRLPGRLSRKRRSPRWRSGWRPVRRRPAKFATTAGCFTRRPRASCPTANGGFACRRNLPSGPGSPAR